MDISDSDINESEVNTGVDNDMTSVDSFNELKKAKDVIITNEKLSAEFNIQNSEVNWEGDDSVDPNPVQVPFRKSSDLMSRHAEIYIQKSMVPRYYSHSDGGRRNKVESFKDVWSSSESEYESPDEEEFYDPRQISKWKWETDYTSLPSDYNSSSTKSDDELSYKACKFYIIG